MSLLSMLSSTVSNMGIMFWFLFPNITGNLKQHTTMSIRRKNKNTSNFLFNIIPIRFPLWIWLLAPFLWSMRSLMFLNAELLIFTINLLFLRYIQKEFFSHHG